MTILVLCTGNSCRSQMVEGFLRKYLNPTDTVYSAGIAPESVNPFAVAVMKEVGIDISAYKSNHVDEYLEQQIDIVLTVCDHARESCPVFPKKTKRIHHGFSDPAKARGDKEEVLDVYRKSRDEIRAYCKQLTLEINS